MPAFDIITDSTANLTQKLIKENSVIEIPFPYFTEGKEPPFCTLEEFDDIKNGLKVITSQINPQKYIDFFRPSLENGRDVLFIGLSSGISGSFTSATMAREQLAEEFPDRKIELIDSLSAGLGEGLLVLKAASLRADGASIESVVYSILEQRNKLYQVFIADDLIHLKRTGRISNASAIIGTALGIKPLLKGSEEGRIVAFGKIRGRTRAIDAMAEKYFTLAKNPELQTVGITYAGCRADAESLAQKLREKMPPKEFLILKHEPATGSHIGPGSLALFFEGDSDVRTK